MKPLARMITSALRHLSIRSLHGGLLALSVLSGSNAHAAFLSGAALDTAADVMSWVVLLVVPAVCIAVFWLVHILPEKIAEKKHHPQAKAIQTLCLLSLFFGGLLWPLAWLWAYSKPVFYKMAYGTDQVAHGHEADSQPPQDAEAAELIELRRRTAELESRLAKKLAAAGDRA